jgi:hypothetical protein
MGAFLPCVARNSRPSDLKVFRRLVTTSPTHTIHPNTLIDCLHGEGWRELRKRSLGGGIGADAGKSLKAGIRSDVDNGSACLESLLSGLNRKNPIGIVAALRFNMLLFVVTFSTPFECVWKRLTQIRASSNSGTIDCFSTLGNRLCAKYCSCRKGIVLLISIKLKSHQRLYGILCHITDSRIKTSEVPKRSNWPAEELHSRSQTPIGVLSSAGKVTGREKLVSAILLNETEQWRSVECVFHETDARTILVLSFDAVAGVPNNRARQR